MDIAIRYNILWHSNKKKGRNSFTHVDRESEWNGDTKVDINPFGRLYAAF